MLLSSPSGHNRQRCVCSIPLPGFWRLILNYTTSETCSFLATSLHDPDLKKLTFLILYKNMFSSKFIQRRDRSKEAYRTLLQGWQPGELCLAKHFTVVLLDSANQVLGICHLSTTCSYCIFFQPGQRGSVSGFIL
jgi:hypothetical protein